MSIARSLLREFRPLFRMLEEPLRSPSYIGALPTRAFDDPFFGFQSPNLLRPAIDVSEKGSEYVVEAELPGVKKEDVEVRIGDGGRSVTIEGKTSSRGDIPAAEQAPAESSSTEGMFRPTLSFTNCCSWHCSVCRFSKPNFDRAGLYTQLFLHSNGVVAPPSRCQQGGRQVAGWDPQPDHPEGRGQGELESPRGVKNVTRMGLLRQSEQSWTCSPRRVQ